MVWIQFIISSAIIVAAGIRLTIYADALSERLRLGKAWIGIILLGLVTSLPEAVASITAVASLHANDLAIGNMVGSNNFNIVLIFLMDIVYRQGSVTNGFVFRKGSVLPILFAVALTFIISAEICFKGAVPVFGFLGGGALFVGAGYLLGIRILSHYQEEPHVAVEEGLIPGVAARTLPVIYINLFVCAALVVLGAVWLVGTADTIAEITGLGKTFVGTLFLAFVTSLPEMVVTISAVRLGALQMALGNIFGSNMINMFIIFLTDLVYKKGAILATVSQTHLVAAFSSILLSLIVLAGIKYNKKKTLLGLGVDSWVIAIIFLFSMNLVYMLR
ncbi:MAG: sodium:calcium antiporter [Candidatus Omnitrophica bacterium]|nr:sodium:calcium antiporter [Candidatus Omnitrophota bacterium]